MKEIFKSMQAAIRRINYEGIKADKSPYQIKKEIDSAIYSIAHKAKGESLFYPDNWQWLSGLNYTLDKVAEIKTQTPYNPPLDDRLKDFKEWRKLEKLTGEKHQDVDLTDEEIEKIFETPITPEKQYNNIDYSRAYRFKDRHVYKHNTSGQRGRFQIFIEREAQIKK